MALFPKEQEDAFTAALITHQDLEKTNSLLRRLTAEGKTPAAYSLGRLLARAEMDHVVLTDDILDQVADSHDLNDATGYYAIWLMKRTEANGGIFKRDW